MHKRYYRLHKKHLNKSQLQKYLTKLKKRDRYAFWKKVPTQAIKEIESPLYHLKNLSKLKKLNKNLSKKKKGSNSRKRARLQLAKLHTKISNQRRDFFHKLSNKLADSYENIFIEDLNMKAMQMLWGRKISDLAFSEFINILEYKTNVVKIDRFYPSSKFMTNCNNLSIILK